MSKFFITKYFISMGVYAGISDSKKCFHSRRLPLLFLSELFIQIRIFRYHFEEGKRFFLSHFLARMVEQQNHIRLFSNRVGLQEISWSTCQCYQIFHTFLEFIIFVCSSE